VGIFFVFLMWTHCSKGCSRVYANEIRKGWTDLLCPAVQVRKELSGG